jgi:hypothetical protein
MKTQNLIQTVANVIKITSLKKGDVVKIIDSSSYNTEVSFAVVLDLMNDGENAFIEFLKYKKSYNSVDAEIKIYKGTEDLSLFPTNIEELKENFNNTIENLNNKIEEKKEELQKMIVGRDKAKEFISGELSKTLSEVEFSEIEQSKFIQLQKEKEEKIKELEQN